MGRLAQIDAEIRGLEEEVVRLERQIADIDQHLGETDDDLIATVLQSQLGVLTTKIERAVAAIAQKRKEREAVAVEEAVDQAQQAELDALEKLYTRQGQRLSAATEEFNSCCERQAAELRALLERYRVEREEMAKKPQHINDEAQRIYDELRAKGRGVARLHGFSYSFGDLYRAAQDVFGIVWRHFR